MSHRRAIVTVVLSVLLSACTPPGLPPPLAPESTAQSTGTPTPSETLNIGVDGSINGFNPYLVADFSPVSRAVAGLILPSVSRIDAAGELQLNGVLIQNATVTSTDPFTVRYVIDSDASWSDGTPVTAEDFRYLWQQLLTTDGTVQAAPYRHISTITSSAGGKQVAVEFDQPVAAWRQLFSPLLPAHILKDAPGGFPTAMSAGIPVSAGPYRLDSLDRATGQLTLVRNDKYWAQQPAADKVVLRSAESEELVDGLARGDLQAIYARLGIAAAERLRTNVPLTHRRQIPVPASIQLVMNTAGGPLSDVRTRRAIGHALNLDVLRDLLSGSDLDGLLPVGSFTTLPAAGGSGAQPRELTADATAARRNLLNAGYTFGGAYARSALGPLRLVLGFPTQDGRAATVARAVQRQLGGAGVVADVVPMLPTVLVSAIQSGDVDLALVTVPRNPSDAVATASGFGCPQAEVSAANLSRTCENNLDRQLTALLRDNSAAALAQVDRRLWEVLPVIPIGQPIAQLAVSPELATVPALIGDAGWWAGPLAGLPSWPVS